jgi:protein ImuB
MYACVYIPGLADASALRECAEAFSPTVEFAEEAAIFDIRGLRRLYGSPESIGTAIAQRVSSMGARVGIAANPHAAMAAARGFAGLTVIPPGEEASVLASLPLDQLAPEEELKETLADWGVRTFADLAALPEGGVAERLGSAGLRLRELARGLTSRPMKPAKDAVTFDASMDLDEGVDLLEPLMFIFSRLLNDICVSLTQHGLAANELTLRLGLEGKREFTRALRLPFASRDAQTFLKLLQYDLSAHPPKAAIFRVHLRATPVHPRVVQGGLFVPLAPQPEKLELTLARITSIVGEGKAGAPELVDIHRPGAFRMTRFSAKEVDAPGSVVCSEPRLAVRLFRPPLPAEVAVLQGRPERVKARGVQGEVEVFAGPWRTSGDWVTVEPWSFDEWDVALREGGVYRLRCADGKAWFVEGNYD